ncbi:MAG: hypothetical protein KF830_10985 [Planctomycetes bacterium]|nr:hypothetical protein [Planctomycetota bacterium]
MPIDCSVTGPLILVRNHAGVTLPFSTGMLATSILVTGIATPLAYELAADIAAELHTGPAREVDGDDLVERVAVRLEARVDAAAAERYRAWRKARRCGRPLVLCLSGAPGVGKSTVATRLALRLGVQRVVPTDAIREVLRTVIPASVLPELHLAAYEAARTERRRDAADSAFVRQARAVGGALVAVADRMVREGRSVLIEGAHLLPGDVRDELRRRDSQAIVVELLCTMDDERLHRAYMLRRTRVDPAQPGLRHLRNFAAIRALQEDLRDWARAAGVLWHDLGNLHGLTESIVDRFVAEAQAAAAEGRCVAAEPDPCR